MTAIDDIAAERLRQMHQEGWSIQHDDTHVKGEMAKAAACYALNGTMLDVVREIQSGQLVFLRRYWPWALKWWKPKDRRRDLVRAGALIVAEIDRLDRAVP